MVNQHQHILAIKAKSSEHRSTGLVEGHCVVGVTVRGPGGTAALMPSVLDRAFKDEM